MNEYICKCVKSHLTKDEERKMILHTICISKYSLKRLTKISQTKGQKNFLLKKRYFKWIRYIFCISWHVWQNWTILFFHLLYFCTSERKTDVIVRLTSKPSSKIINPMSPGKGVLTKGWSPPPPIKINVNNK